MERNLRFRISGLIFFIVLILNLALSKSGQNYLAGLLKPQNGPNTPIQIIIPIASAIVLFFASDTTGFIFSSVYLFVFNRFVGGYNGIYSRKLGYSKLKTAIMNTYKSMKPSPSNEFSHQEFESKWGKYNTEQFLIYFLWHRPDPHDHLNAWVERRHTAYFTSYSSLTAIIFATILSFSIIYGSCLGLTSTNWMALSFTVLFSFAIVWNGEHAMRDAIAITDLRIAGFVNPRVKETLRQFPPPTDSDEKQRSSASGSRRKKKRAAYRLTAVSRDEKQEEEN